MSGKFQRTYREACPSSASSHERYYMPHPTPPHLTRAYMHLPAATDKHVLPPQVHMNVITCPTPPQTRPTPPPRCVQKAVVQLVLVVYLCNKVLRGPQLQSCQGTHEKSLDSRHLILAK